MNAAQTLTLVVGLSTAALSVCWAVKESRRDYRDKRFALIDGPLGGGTLWTVLAACVLLVPLLYLIFAFELVPRNAPGLFVTTLGWVTVAFISGIIAAISIQVRRNAMGWITLVDEDTVRVEAHGTDATLRLQAGAAQLYFADAGPQYLQFVISEGAAQVKVWGMVSIKGLSDATQGVVVRAEGLMLAGSAEPLRKWLSRFVKRD